MCHRAICVCSCGRVNPRSPGGIGPRTVWTWAMARDATPSGPARGARRASRGRSGAIVWRMRVILDAEIQPDTISRLRALSTDLEVVDVSGDATFDPLTMRVPEAGVVSGSRVP